MDKAAARRRQLEVFNWWVIAKYLHFLKRQGIEANTYYSATHKLQVHAPAYECFVRVLDAENLKAELWGDTDNPFKLILLIFGYKLPEGKNTPKRGLFEVVAEIKADCGSNELLLLKQAYPKFLDEIYRQAEILDFTKGLIVATNTHGSQKSYQVNPSAMISCDELPLSRLKDVFQQTSDLLATLKDLGIPQQLNYDGAYFQRQNYSESEEKYFFPAQLQKFISQCRNDILGDEQQFLDKIMQRTSLDKSRFVPPSRIDDDPEQPLLSRNSSRADLTPLINASKNKRSSPLRCFSLFAASCTVITGGTLVIAATLSKPFEQLLQELHLQDVFAWLYQQIEKTEPSEYNKDLAATIAPLVAIPIVVALFWLLVYCCCCCWMRKNSDSIRTASDEDVEDGSSIEYLIEIDDAEAQTMVDTCQRILQALQHGNFSYNNALLQWEQDGHNSLENLLYRGDKLFDFTCYSRDTTKQIDGMRFADILLLTLQTIQKSNPYSIYQTSVTKYLKCFYTNNVDTTSNAHTEMMTSYDQIKFDDTRKIYIQAVDPHSAYSLVFVYYGTIRSLREHLPVISQEELVRTPPTKLELPPGTTTSSSTTATAATSFDSDTTKKVTANELLINTDASFNSSKSDSKSEEEDDDDDNSESSTNSHSGPG